MNAHGFMDRVQSVTSFISSSVQTRVTEGSSIVNFYPLSSFPLLIAVGCQGDADRFRRYEHLPHTFPIPAEYMLTWFPQCFLLWYDAVQVAQEYVGFSSVSQNIHMFHL